MRSPKLRAAAERVVVALSARDLDHLDLRMAGLEARGRVDVAPVGREGRALLPPALDTAADKAMADPSGAQTGFVARNCGSVGASASPPALSNV